MKAIAPIVFIAGLLTGCAHFARPPLPAALVGHYSHQVANVTLELQLDENGRYREVARGPTIIFHHTAEQPQDPVSDQGWAEASLDKFVLHSDQGDQRVFSIIAGPPLILREHVNESILEYRQINEPAG